MSEAVRLGILRLTDAAPIIIADHEKIFTQAGIAVEITIEPSWANIADKLGYGLLDGAVMLPPLAIACALGLRGRKTDLVVPMSLSANGDAITLAAGLQTTYEARGALSVFTGQKRRMAVVHAFSTHDLLLRYWLAASGVNPETEVDIIVLSPAEMIGSLAAGAIDGFCAGAPWGEVAEHSRLGFKALTSDKIWANHPEKCLALRADFAAGDPARVRSLISALMDAARLCANPARRPALAARLAEPSYLDVPAALIAQSLDPAAGGPVFTLNYPNPQHAAWFAMQMLRWNKAPPEVVSAAGSLYKPDIFIAAGGKKPETYDEVFCDSKK